MSHYAVLVIGDDPEGQLAPFHKFESTGDDNQYVQNIDQTEEARAQYTEHTTTRYRDPEGILHNPYTEEGNAKPQFWRDPTPEEIAEHGKMFGSGFGGGIRWLSTDWNDGLGYRAKVFQLPEGWNEVEVPTPEAETLAKFVEGWYGHKVVPFGEQPDLVGKHKYGYTLVDSGGTVVKVVDRTNPNKKWDWYSVGGRWTGYFKLKAVGVGVLGKPGIQAIASDYKAPERDRADLCRKCDIDIEGMRNEAEEKAARKYDLVWSIIGAHQRPLTWEEVKKLHQNGVDGKGRPNVDFDAARKYYNQQPAVVALRENETATWYEVDDFLVAREEYLRRARAGALTTFAVIKDGQWYERGSMGWWGVVSNEEDHDEWNIKFASLIDGLPDDTILTIIDCHI
jgi:hypothetical protein